MATLPTSSSNRTADRTRLDELEPLIGKPLTGDATTIGGLVQNILGRLAVVGDRITVDGVEIEVEALTRRAISSVLLKRLPESDEPEIS